MSLSFYLHHTHISWLGRMYFCQDSYLILARPQVGHVGAFVVGLYYIHLAACGGVSEGSACWYSVTQPATPLGTASRWGRCRFPLSTLLHTNLFCSFYLFIKITAGIPASSLKRSFLLSLSIMRLKANPICWRSLHTIKKLNIRLPDADGQNYEGIRSR